MKDLVLGSVQPSYLAWIPLFKRIKMSDVFVYLDDVEYSKNSFHNRNRIKTSQGALMLTVPILYKGHSTDFIKDMPINNNLNWAIKHWRSIEQSYSKTKYFNQLSPWLWENFYSKKWECLADLNIALIEFFRKFLKIKTKCYRSSTLNVEGEGNEKLVNLCKKLGATKFIVKPGTEHYHPKEFFKNHRIEFNYFTFKFKPYCQLYRKFIAGLSILDYVMNCGSNDF